MRKHDQTAVTIIRQSHTAYFYTVHRSLYTVIQPHKSDLYKLSEGQVQVQRKGQDTSHCYECDKG